MRVFLSLLGLGRGLTQQRGYLLGHAHLLLDHVVGGGQGLHTHLAEFLVVMHLLGDVLKDAEYGMIAFQDAYGQLNMFLSLSDVYLLAHILATGILGDEELRRVEEVYGRQSFQADCRYSEQFLSLAVDVHNVHLTVQHHYALRAVMNNLVRHGLGPLAHVRQADVNVSVTVKDSPGLLPAGRITA